MYQRRSASRSAGAGKNKKKMWSVDSNPGTYWLAQIHIEIPPYLEKLKSKSFVYELMRGTAKKNFKRCREYLPEITSDVEKNLYRYLTIQMARYRAEYHTLTMLIEKERFAKEKRIKRIIF